MWKKKRINLTEARALSYKFCKDFDIEYCQIYYVDVLKYNLKYNYYGLYVWLDPPHILILDKYKVINKIGVVIHELTHHLEYKEYECDDSGATHGYEFILAKQRVITWARNNISKKADWNLPLKAFQSKKDMVAFKL